mmetsp:Transcript_28356/g.65720  ORF Transcript_28356/g.65720 Transcript_28356/m.65720 type:complete len:265 (-) Transcript_28356:662-1456(-)
MSTMSSMWQSYGAISFPPLPLAEMARRRRSVLAPLLFPDRASVAFSSTSSPSSTRNSRKVTGSSLSKLSPSTPAGSGTFRSAMGQLDDKEAPFLRSARALRQPLEGAPIFTPSPASVVTTAIASPSSTQSPSAAVNFRKTPAVLAGTPSCSKSGLRSGHSGGSVVEAGAGAPSAVLLTTLISATTLLSENSSSGSMFSFTSQPSTGAMMVTTWLSKLTVASISPAVTSLPSGTSHFSSLGAKGLRESFVSRGCPLGRRTWLPLT